MNIPWFLKYKPKRFTDLIFSSDVHLKALKWMKEHENNGILNITGRPGFGKTCLATAIGRALGFEVTEIDDKNYKELREIIKEQSGTLSGKRRMVVVDEGEIENTGQFLGVLRNNRIPIIITSVNTFCREIVSFRIEKPNFSNFIEISQKIARAENTKIDDRNVLKIAEKCGFDIRAVINCLQVFSRSTSFGVAVERDVLSFNIFGCCKLILSKRLKLDDLERIYSKNIARFCMSSIMRQPQDCNESYPNKNYSTNCNENYNRNYSTNYNKNYNENYSKNYNRNSPDKNYNKSYSASSINFSSICSAIQDFSDFDGLPEKYQFLSLYHLNQISTEFVYTKDETPSSSRPDAHESPLLYLPFYSRSFSNLSGIRHLQEIFEKYKIELNEKDQEIKNYIFSVPKESKSIKYRYNQGSSNAVKRDISLWEFLNS